MANKATHVPLVFGNIIGFLIGITIAFFQATGKCCSFGDVLNLYTSWT